MELDQVAHVNAHLHISSQEFARVGLRGFVACTVPEFLDVYCSCYFQLSTNIINKLVNVIEGSAT